MFILLTFAFVFAFAQNDEKSNEIRTLSGQKDLGFYGAATIGYSQMEAKDALLIGGRAGLIFNHSAAIGVVRNDGPGTWEDPWNIEMPENDFFFVLEPAVDLEFNLTSFFRMAATLSYRFTSNVEFTGKTPDVLQGWNFGLNI